TQMNLATLNKLMRLLSQAVFDGIAATIQEEDISKQYAKIQQVCNEKGYAAVKKDYAVGGTPEEVKELLVKQGDKIKTTAENFLIILRNDLQFSNIFYNALKDYPEKLGYDRMNKQVTREPWTDADGAAVRTYIESTYGLSSKEKCNDAFLQLCQERKYNPMVDTVDGIIWDGLERCSTFLIKWLGAADTKYNREVSRLIFSGGIHRLYNPGCKFDAVPVFIGKQGGGKSTICKWLALNEQFYVSTKTIFGKAAIDNIQGKWIAEIEELLAVYSNEKQGQAAEEGAKAFLSTDTDYMRQSYGHRSKDLPRTCIFIGTTNRDTFLTDKTGNRRWYPVRCNMDARDIWDHEKECKEYIQQCWAEMREAYANNSDFAKPYADYSIVKEIKAEQDAAEIDDWQIGAIAEYIQDKEYTCCYKIYTEALYPDATRKPSKRESNDIAEILVHKLNWQKGKPQRYKDAGQQVTFYPKGENIKRDDNIDF
ncbi:MAG: VapE family protein, partial [Bacillota bacterium]|nr:VapE family protein [Bacillota bacterium]